MQLDHTFTVPAGVDQAWQVLLDIERVAPCLPGASLDSVDGDDLTGTVKVRLGPISLTYKGKARFAEKDEAAHRAVIEAQGRDSRGNGTASATVTATLQPDGEQATTVAVHTDLTITGKPAQFGRGVLVDVSNKLIGQFADCLAGKLAGSGAEVADEAAPSTPVVDEAVAGEAATGEASAGEAATGEAAATAEATAATQPAAAAAEPPARHAAPETAPIDLLSTAGPAVLKRLAPVVVLALAVLLFVILRRRR